MKVHIHVVYLRLRTSYTKNNAVKTWTRSKECCFLSMHLFTCALSASIPIVLYHSKTPGKASAWNGPQSPLHQFQKHADPLTHCNSLTRADTCIAKDANGITSRKRLWPSWTSPNQRLYLLLPTPRPGALPLPFLRGWISIAFPCLMIDTHRPRSLITTGGKENVDGHPGLTGFRFLRHPMPLTVQDQNISMSHHDPLALNSHLPVRTQRKSELATVMDVIGTRIFAILIQAQKRLQRKNLTIWIAWLQVTYQFLDQTLSKLQMCWWRRKWIPIKGVGSVTHSPCRSSLQFSPAGTFQEVGESFIQLSNRGQASGDSIQDRHASWAKRSPPEPGIQC